MSATTTTTHEHLWPGQDDPMSRAMMFSLRGTRRAIADGKVVGEHAVKGELHVRPLPNGDWQLIRIVRWGAWRVEWRGQGNLIGRTLQAILRPEGAPERGFVASYRVSRDGMGIVELVMNPAQRPPEEAWTTIEGRGVLLGRSVLKSERAAS